MIYKDVYIACSHCDNDMFFFDEVNVNWEGLNFKIEGMDCDLCCQNKWYIDSFDDDDED